jgi:hypothetical protein
MPSCAWAKLEIGGRVDRQVLIDAIIDNTELSEEDVEQALEELKAGQAGDADGRVISIYVDDGHLVIEDPDAVYAQFTDLENELLTLGVPFDRTSEDVAEFDGGIAWYRPELGLIEAAHNDGQAMVSLDEVRAKLKEGPEALVAWLTSTYPEPGPLPPLVVEGAPLGVPSDDTPSVLSTTPDETP